MSHKKNLSTCAWLMATTLLGGGGYIALWQNDPAPHEGVKLTAPALPSASTASSAISATAPSLAAFQGASGSANAPHGAQTLDELALAKEDPSKITSSTKLARYFFMRYLSTTTWTDKMDNLRWTITQFGDVNSPETLDKAAKGLLLPKAELVKILRETAQEMFKQESSPATASRFDQMSYWNNRRLAFPFAGLDDQGVYNDSLAAANTGYTLDQIVRNRDSFTVSAAYEISPSVKETAIELHRLSEQHKESGLGLGSSWRQALESLSLDKKIELRDHIYLITYVVERQMSGTTEESLQLLNLNEDIYAHLDQLKHILDDPIYDAFSKQAEKRDYSLNISPSPQPEQARGLSFPDIVQIFSNPLFYKAPH